MTMEDVCQMMSNVMTMMTVETTVMMRDVVCMWCEIWFNDPALIHKEAARKPSTYLWISKILQ